MHLKNRNNCDKNILIMSIRLKC